MISYLLVFQFVFLYCLSLFIGLFVYGSDMGSLPGRIYAVSIISLLLGITILQRRFSVNLPLWANRAILLCGALSALVLYKTLHFSYWDEHSLQQSALMGILGLSSFFSAIIATKKTQHNPVKMTLALIIIALAWLASSQYPMAAIFFICVILFLGLLDNTPSSINLVQTAQPQLRLEYHCLFIAMMDISLVVWDYQVNTRWGFYLFTSLLSAALVQFLYPLIIHRLRAKRIQLRNEYFYLALLLNFAYAVIFNDYILSFWHSIFSGALLGLVLSNLYLKPNKKFHIECFIISAPAIIWALIIGYAFYGNLEQNQWRAIFLLPALLLIFKRWRSHALTAH